MIKSNLEDSRLLNSVIINSRESSASVLNSVTELNCNELPVNGFSYLKQVDVLRDVCIFRNSHCTLLEKKHLASYFMNLHTSVFELCAFGIPKNMKYYNLGKLQIAQTSLPSIIIIKH